MNLPDNHEQANVTEWLLAVVVGCGVAAGVWWGLLNGGGLIGGDTYTYFLPQKVTMAEAFATGEIPLWHPLTGLGYPLLAESQAGVFYPPNQILYRLFEVNTAYHWGIVGHYCLAFVFAWRFGRCQKISNTGSLLAALIFVYGWFPARISHEWSIIGGMWFPLTLWITDKLLQKPSRRLFIVLVLCLATHLLSGHFTLAFINQLTLVGYALMKTSETPPTWMHIWKRSLIPVLATGLAIGCAAIQLLPTYELKLASQRHGEIQNFDPAFGHMPPAYISQLFASWWYWHTPEILQSKQMATTTGAVSADTNHVEAHLYWGLLPFVLVVISATGVIRRQLDCGVYRTWLVLTVASIIYATGWLMPVTRHLPGFGFFNGPGRYTMIAALGGAIIAASVFDLLTRRTSRWLRILVGILLGSITLSDMLLSSKHVADAIVVEKSPLQNVDKSWIRDTVGGADRWTHRLLAPGPNVGNFFNVSCVPQYLGLGPAIYYDRILMPATGPNQSSEEFPAAHEIANLQRLGITHILTTDAVANLSSSIRLKHQYPDAFLNAVWGRGSAACYLYEFKERPERITTSAQNSLLSYEITSVTGNSFEFEVDVSQTVDVVLRELNYPGWVVSVDGDITNAATFPEAPFLRSVSVPTGRHSVRWEFKPKSFVVGALVSVAFLIAAAFFVLWPKKATSAEPNRKETL